MDVLRRKQCTFVIEQIVRTDDDSDVRVHWVDCTEAQLPCINDTRRTWLNNEAYDIDVDNFNDRFDITRRRDDDYFVDFPCVSNMVNSVGDERTSVDHKKRFEEGWDDTL